MGRKRVEVEVLPTREQIGEVNDGAMFAEGFDDCLLGYVERFGMEAPVAMYDRERVIQKLVARDRMTRETAEEFFTVNIIGAFVGPNTPAFATVLRK